MCDLNTFIRADDVLVNLTLFGSFIKVR